MPNYEWWHETYIAIVSPLQIKREYFSFIILGLGTLRNLTFKLWGIIYIIQYGVKHGF